jgi:uncharacterized protein involved in exopolysaccharide biosynthesis
MVSEKERKMMLEKGQREINMLKREREIKEKQLEKSYSKYAELMRQNSDKYMRKIKAVWKKYEKYMDK